MDAIEMIKIQEDILLKYNEYLLENPSRCIKVEKRFGNKSYFENLMIEGECMMDGFFTTKLRVYYEEGKLFSIDKLHISLLETFIVSGLANKNEGKILLSDIMLSPTIYDTAHYTPKRCVLATIKYEFKNIE
jgi:hypothetical protein